MEGYPVQWPTEEAFPESLSHCPAGFVEDATKAFLECRSENFPWPPWPQELSLSLPPPPPPPPPTLTLGQSEHLPKLPSEHREASTKQEKKRSHRKRPSSEPSLCSVVGTDGQETKKKEGRRKKIEDWNQEHFETRTRLLSAMHWHVVEPGRNHQCLLLKMKVCL